MNAGIPDGAASSRQDKADAFLYSAEFGILVAADAGSGWLTGSDLVATNPPSLARQTDGCSVWADGARIDADAQTTPDAQPHATLSRWVLWQVSSVGQVIPIHGTPDQHPVMPAVDITKAYLAADLLGPNQAALVGAPTLDLRIPLRPVTAAARPPTVITSTPGGTLNLDGTVDSYDVTVTADLTINLTADAPTVGRPVLVMLHEDSVGTWNLVSVNATAGDVLWLGGNPPSLLTGAGARTKMTLTFDGGAWLGEWANYL